MSSNGTIASARGGHGGAGHDAGGLARRRAAGRGRCRRAGRRRRAGARARRGGRPRRPRTAPRSRPSRSCRRPGCRPRRAAGREGAAAGPADRHRIRPRGARRRRARRRGARSTERRSSLMPGRSANASGARHPCPPASTDARARPRRASASAARRARTPTLHTTTTGRLDRPRDRRAPRRAARGGRRASARGDLVRPRARRAAPAGRRGEGVGEVASGDRRARSAGEGVRRRRRRGRRGCGGGSVAASVGGRARSGTSLWRARSESITSTRPSSGSPMPAMSLIASVAMSDADLQAERAEHADLGARGHVAACCRAGRGPRRTAGRRRRAVPTRTR